MNTELITEKFYDLDPNLECFIQYFFKTMNIKFKKNIDISPDSKNIFINIFINDIINEEYYVHYFNNGHFGDYDCYALCNIHKPNEYLIYYENIHNTYTLYINERYNKLIFLSYIAFSNSPPSYNVKIEDKLFESYYHELIDFKYSIRKEYYYLKKNYNIIKKSNINYTNVLFYYYNKYIYNIKKIIPRMYKYSINRRKIYTKCINIIYVLL